ncbi:MAG: hypothetical protein GX933_01750 [Chloroflexi bacterium]|jgi:hypothetical protein|nr:hypothetical protein [Chloroflexota bacterium]
MQIHPFLPIILVGTLRQDYILTPGGKAINNTPGGHLFHTAMGLIHSERQFGLVSRTGLDFPENWLEDFSVLGMDIRGIKQTGISIDQRFFIRHDDSGKKSTLNPLAQYAEEGLPFPKSLLGYQIPVRNPDSFTERNSETIIARDIPHDYLESPTIHFCPMDFLTHNLITQKFMQVDGKKISIRSGKGYMSPRFLPLMGSMLQGLNVFFTSKAQLKNLFSEQNVGNLSDMVWKVADMGVELIVIQEDDFSNLLYIAAGKEIYKLEPYPVSLKNRTGIKDAFCGGFIGNLAKTYQPLKALVAGTTAASFTMEANQPYYASDTIAGLFSARESYIADRIVRLN